MCDRACLFGDEACALPRPLREMAQGLRALPPPAHVGDTPLPVPALCWAAPLWGNPLFTASQSWDWFGQQRGVAVGLECVAPPGLVGLPALRCLGDAVCLRVELERLRDSRDPSLLPVAYASVWRGWLGRREVYAAALPRALGDVVALLGLVPAAWVAAAQAQAPQAAPAPQALASVARVPPADVGAACVAACECLGWVVPPARPGAASRRVLLASLKVRLATGLQTLPACAAIAERHAVFLDRVRALDGLPGRRLPPVVSALARWWRLRVANVYKEPAWRLALDAFPTAARMDLDSPCVACGVRMPGCAHHFWTCPVAEAVRLEVEAQLAAWGWLAAGARLCCSSLWLGCVPHEGLHRMVWDMVCLAAVHACERGRAVAWAVRGLPGQTLGGVCASASRAAVGAFWEALADFAATAYVPRSSRTHALVAQPFLAWHPVLVAGNGLRVVRRE